MSWVTVARSVECENLAGFWDAQGRRLNIYQKAKFADSFKSTLLANGLDTAIAGAVTRRLVRHLSLEPDIATQRESHQALLTRADQLFDDGLLADAIEC